MFPFKSILKFDRKNSQPLYLQLANQFIELIKDRKLPPRTKLPGSRTLAALLQVHRKTVVACYDELILQGWTESIPKKGTFVHADLPELQQQNFSNLKKVKGGITIGFPFYEDSILHRKSFESGKDFTFLNDGITDTRLTPTDDLARIYRRVSSKKAIFREMSYGSLFGNEKLRQTLSDYLNETRGLNITKKNILITRGSQMGIFLTSKLLLKEKDIVIVGETNYGAADITFKERRASLLRVPVDENGIDTCAIERLCQKHRIKAVYVTSHHHHPTTVTLSAERRIHLLNLAKHYKFAILEDDYDYDFNYNHAPILPLASHDVNGNVIYIGSVCKTVAPVFRIGYLIAPEVFVNEASKFRRIVDRQGDALLELTFAEFIKSGDLDRHIKKTMKVYKIRRDLFCSLLQKELDHVFTFDIPKGGMAVWVTLNKKYSWENVSHTARKYKLEIGEWQRYDEAQMGHNSIRIGFATYNQKEILALINKFKLIFNDLG
jgi:GntR family transcriptional regulator/MocR family aminotransferase